MKKKANKLKPMSPHEARTAEEIDSLESDNYNTAEGWLLLQGPYVTIGQQKPGEPAVAMVKLTRDAFKRLINWYLLPQDRSPGSASGEYAS